MNKNIVTAFLIVLLLLTGGAVTTSAETVMTSSTVTSDTSSLAAKVEMLMKQIEELKAALAAQKKEIHALREEFKLTRRLGKGDQGDEVKLLQQVLATDPEIYPEGKVTGFYGALTEKAVKRFQAKAGLEGVGLVGPKTREVLNKVLEDGADTSGVIPTGLLKEHGTYAMAKLTAQNDSGLWGPVKIAATGDGKTRVVIELMGDSSVIKPTAGSGADMITNMPVPTSGPYLSHIHAGKGPTRGAVKYPLSPVVNGRSETVLEVKYEELVKHIPLAVNLHKSADDLATYVACGDVHISTFIWQAGAYEGMVKPKIETIQQTPPRSCPFIAFPACVGKPVIGADGCIIGWKCDTTEVSATLSSEPATSAATQPTTSTAMSETRVVELVASNFKFSTGEIRVKKGERVKVMFKVESGFHDWVLDEFTVRTKQLFAGDVGIVEFVADKAGVFEYYCSVGSHRAMGMVGKFVVEG